MLFLLAPGVQAPESGRKWSCGGQAAFSRTSRPVAVLETAM